MKGGEKMTQDIGLALLASLGNGLTAVTNFVPKFIAGAIILLVGIIIASILKQLVVEVSRALNVEGFLRKYGVPEGKEKFNWTSILAQIVRWFVIIIFLIPTADVWGLPQIVTVLNTFLLYLPNVFVATVIALVGFVFARLAHDVVLASIHGVSKETASTVASVTRTAIVIFVLLAVLNQLGVATDLIRILFTGFVAMVALAGGIAFGLGGKDVASDILTALRKKLE